MSNASPSLDVKSFIDRRGITAMQWLLVILCFLIVASDAHRAHHPREPFLDAGQLIDPPEIPERVDRILGAIADARLGAPLAPREFGLDPIQRGLRTTPQQ